MIHFDNSYARLPQGFFARVAPTPVAQPRLLALNDGLARRLGLDADWLTGPEGVAMLAGNAVPQGAEPIAQAYAGHQFGGFVPQLGDGRAVLLGEVVAPDGARFDIQLKGSGPTPFSRRGDGRAWVGPVLREYIVSEFMHAMGVPTTRALAAVATGETVWRESGLPGAVLTRVASSHIRVGTFQYFAVRGQEDALAALTDHVIARHYPTANGPLSLLDHVIARQAETIAHWMALGFIHGVMNTDNMAVSGETIDYGPCAFMDAYHPDTVFSSIDRGGRYAWAQQPQIAVWNLAQLATCLIPLMGERDAAIEAATKSVHSFAPIYQAAWRRRFGEKLGLTEAADVQPLAERLLTMMAQQRADFTRVFAGLADGRARDEFIDREAFDAWAVDWQAQNPDPELMRHANPVRIPRNHQIEEAIVAAVADDLGPFQRLFDAVIHPREARAEWDDLSHAPLAEQIVHQTFCGT
ncbi:YdiU family protein [Paracoccus sp. WLY502]|uniref:protein adenylyltransferase SelO n=1 Tax=Paracoccus yibinensis TaxID=3068891 RepID=UPI0027966B54|nr:YdiU family protein [Paracoccus sp. WLY502]MDQ1898963.1 YdiU family protein [Paracoccus sp. WLY502]